MTSSLDLFELLREAALFLPSVSSYKFLHYIETLNESRRKLASHRLRIFLLSDLVPENGGSASVAVQCFQSS